MRFNNARIATIQQINLTAFRNTKVHSKKKRKENNNNNKTPPWHPGLNLITFLASGSLYIEGIHH